MIPLWAIRIGAYALAAAAVAWALHAGYSSIWQRGYDARDAEATLSAAVAERTAAIAAIARESETRAIETAIAARVHAVAERYEQDRRHAAETADRVVADLRSGAARLRREWQGCVAAASGPPLPGAGVAATGADAAADDRNDAAGLVVRAGAECDARVIGLQGYIRSIHPALRTQ